MDNNEITKKEKDFLIGLMYNDGDLNHLSEGTTDYIGESYVDFKKDLKDENKE